MSDTSNTEAALSSIFLASSDVIGSSGINLLSISSTQPCSTAISAAVGEEHSEESENVYVSSSLA